jgi:rhodanese-related sulfurtransferase
MGDAVKNIAPDAVREDLAKGAITLIDVREPHEFGAERIHGALLFPLSTFDPKALPANGDKPVVLHCGSGKRSATAIARCREAGVPVDAHMEGGIQAWKRKGFPTVTVDPATGKVRDAV